METQRLKLREVLESDSVFVLELFNSPGYLQFIGDRQIRTLPAAAQYIRSKFIKSYEQFGFGMYIVEKKEDKEPVGMCGLVKRTFLEYPDVGFAMLPAHEGKGYTTETGLFMINHGLTKLNLPKIWGITTKENIASQTVLIKIGLKKIGTTIFEPTQEEVLLFSTK